MASPYTAKDRARKARAGPRSEQGSADRQVTKSPGILRLLFVVSIQKGGLPSHGRVTFVASKVTKIAFPRMPANPLCASLAAGQGSQHVLMQIARARLLPSPLRASLARSSARRHPRVSAPLCPPELSRANDIVTIWFSCHIY